MALRNIVSAQDGPRVTVNTLVKSPGMVPKRVVRSLQNQFIADTLLRDGGDAPGGVVGFTESDPLFPVGSVGIKEEFGEYPIIYGQEGEPKVATAINRGFSILVSEDMRRRNSMDRVNKQMMQGRNLMIKTWDQVVRDSILLNGSIPTLPATAVWSNNTTARIRTDLLAAKFALEGAVSGGQAENFLGFTADTAVMSRNTANNMLGNDLFASIYTDGLAAQNPKYTGTLPQQVYGLTILVSWTWPDNRVLVCEKNTLGFIADERPLRSTELYPEKRSTEVWRSDTSRISAIGIDQPQAAVLITGT